MWAECGRANKGRPQPVALFALPLGRRVQPCQQRGVVRVRDRCIRTSCGDRADGRTPCVSRGVISIPRFPSGEALDQLRVVCTRRDPRGARRECETERSMFRSGHREQSVEAEWLCGVCGGFDHMAARADADRGRVVVGRDREIQERIAQKTEIGYAML